MLLWSSLEPVTPEELEWFDRFSWVCLYETSNSFFTHRLYKQNVKNKRESAATVLGPPVQNPAAKMTTFKSANTKLSRFHTCTVTLNVSRVKTEGAVRVNTTVKIIPPRLRPGSLLVLCPGVCHVWTEQTFKALLPQHSIYLFEWELGLHDSLTRFSFQKNK